MADGKVKKALKDLALPVKPSATKAALMVADMVKKAPASGASGMAAVRKSLGVKVEEKGAVWEGGVVKALVGVAGGAKEKQMIEAVSMCLHQVLIECPENIEIAAKAGAAKVLVEICKDKSLIVQQYAASAISELATHGGAETRQAVISAGGLKNLTAVAAALDSEDAIAKQGINKAIAYEAGARQRAAATALRMLSIEESAKKLAEETGALKQLVTLIANSTDLKTQEEGANALFLLLAEKKNRPLLLACNGLPPLVKLATESSSEHAKTMAAGALKEVSKELQLRETVRKSGAIPPLVQICFEAQSHAAHIEAAGALLELANEVECKVILHDIGAARDIVGLMKSTNAQVLENALAAIGFMCVFGQQNRKQDVVKLSLTSFTDLQDDVCECEGGVAGIVNLIRSKDPVVHNQALCTLTSVCLRHLACGAKAAVASAPDAVVKLLRSDSPVVQANAIHALLSITRTYEPNRREASRLGAPAILLVLKNSGRSELVRSLATEALYTLGVLPSRDSYNSGLTMSNVTIGEPYAKQMSTQVSDDVVELLNEIKACREAVTDLVAKGHGSRAALFVRLAWHDAGTCQSRNVRVVAASNGGANGSIHFSEELERPENKGLEEGVKLLEPIKNSFPRVSWADLIQMAGALSIEQIGGPRMIMVYGRQDADKALDLEGVHVPLMCKIEGVPADEPEKFEKSESSDQPAVVHKSRLELALERLGLTTRQMVAVCGSTVVGWHKLPGETAPKAVKWDVSYFTHVLDEAKARAKPKSEGDEGTELPPLEPDRAMVTSDRFLAFAKRYHEDHSGTLFSDDYADTHKLMSEAGAVFDPRAPEGFYLGLSSVALTSG